MGEQRDPSSARFATDARVWVVDDSPAEAERARSSLYGQHEVQVFHDAAAMLEVVAGGDRPDVLLLDWRMPSGLDACRYVRERHDRASLPIVILTASTDKEDVVEALGAGANDFLRKPVELVELAARVAALVSSRRLHQRLLEAEAGLREEASFREQFLAIVAHDLRQPLNVVALGGSTLAAPATPQRIRERVVVQLSRAAERMQRMIAELLDFSRARPRGGMPIVPGEMDLARLVVEVVGEIRLVHGPETIEVTSDGACRGVWDADRLAQVVSNLVENAMTYRSPGTPVRVAVEGREGRARFSVENTGKTIPDALLPQLFAAYRRGSSTNVGGGLGLGLFIASQIVKAHNGTIEASSADGITRFDVSLPLRRTHGRLENDVPACGN